jgi:hypothetical protein
LSRRCGNLSFLLDERAVELTHTRLEITADLGRHGCRTGGSSFDAVDAAVWSETARTFIGR